MKPTGEIKGIRLETDAELKLAGNMLRDIADKVRRSPDGKLGEMTLRGANTAYEEVMLDRNPSIPAPYSDALLEALKDSVNNTSGPNPELAAEMVEGYNSHLVD